MILSVVSKLVILCSLQFPPLSPSGCCSSTAPSLAIRHGHRQSVLLLLPHREQVCYILSTGLIPRMSKPLAMMVAVASHSSSLHIFTFTIWPAKQQQTNIEAGATAQMNHLCPLSWGPSAPKLPLGRAAHSFILLLCQPLQPSPMDSTCWTAETGLLPFLMVTMRSGPCGALPGCGPAQPDSSLHHWTTPDPGCCL